MVNCQVQVLKNINGKWWDLVYKFKVIGGFSLSETRPNPTPTERHPKAPGMVWESVVESYKRML